MSIFQDPLIEKMETEYISEVQADQDRENRFIMNHPELSRYPVVSDMFLFFNRHGFLQILILGAILLVFTGTKAPYLDVPFTGEHKTKYTTYVEPAVYMVDKNTIFWYQQKYAADPVTNPEGIRSKFPHLPLFEWGLFVAYKIIPVGNLEFKTRMFTHFLGLFILISAYIFFSQWIKKDLALLITACISINPVFVFSTFVTVLDSMVILFMFMSFILLTRYFDSNNIDSLMLSGLTFGLGISIKYSLLLWMGPISLLMIYYRKNSRSQFVFSCLVYIFTGFLFVAAAKTSINILPGDFYKGILVFFVWCIIFFGIRFGLIKYESSICRMMDGVLRRNIYTFIVSSFGIAIACVVFYITDFKEYSEEYLTDKYLFFNLGMYKYMVLSQFKKYMTENILYISITGMLLVLAVGKNNIRKIVLSFSFGSLIYWILTSKVMFFHNYYTIILMITSSILAGFAIYFVLFSLNTNLNKILFGGLIFLIIFPASFKESVKILSEYEDYSQAIEYIKNHTDEKDKLIYEGPTGPIAIYTKRSLIRPFRLNHDQLKNDIHDIGFADTMKKYGIKYLLSPYENPKYIDYANLFINTNMRYPSSNRRYLILKKIGRASKDLTEDYTKLENIVRDYEINNKFILLQDFGRIKIYSFQN